MLECVELVGVDSYIVEPEGRITGGEVMLMVEHLAAGSLWWLSDYMLECGDLDGVEDYIVESEGRITGGEVMMMVVRVVILAYMVYF